MKIQCDVCNKEEVSVLCTADEAALCAACDHRVHRANKLASNHHRFSLLLPSPKDTPLCDICQERRAFLFCQQDRALMCRECDAPIHGVNEHTLTHNRFLLTGVKLSAVSTLYSSAAPQLPTETSSISEYLIETLPGWREEDLLDPSSFPFGFSKTNIEDGLLPFVDSDFDESSVGSFMEVAAGNRRWSDDGFTVPQMNTPSIGSNKRSRPFWLESQK